MLGRRESGGGSVLCPSCRKLVGAGEPRCPFCGYSRPGSFGVLPVLRRLAGTFSLWPVVAGGCFLLYVAMLAVDPEGLAGGRGGVFGMLSPSLETLVSFGGSGATPVLRLGRWWTLLSAGWLHANLLHILFNLMAVRQLAPAVEQIYGGSRSMVIYVLSGVVGFLFSTLSPFAPRIVQVVMGGGGVTVGASAAVFGLLGALLHFTRTGGSRALGQYLWTWAAGLFVFGLVFPGVDNWAHLGGFLGGWGLAAMLDARRPERPLHVGLAAICLAASVAAVLWSVVTAAAIWG
jgi:rhomboid protease GluP